MLRNRRSELVVAYLLTAPFIALYAWLFIWPTIQMVMLTFTDAPLIGEGKAVGFANYIRMYKDPVFWKAVWNTSKSAIRVRILQRSSLLVVFHFGKAFCAAATANSTSSAWLSGIVEKTFPSRGLMLSNLRPDNAGVSSPLI